MGHISRAVIIASIFVSTVLAADPKLDDLWEKFKKQHNKQYNVMYKEEEYRRKIWETNVETIRIHNLEHDLGLHTYTLGINEYADWSFEEYQKYLLGARPPKPGQGHKPTERYRPLMSPRQLPKTVDWRQKGYVTPIKNQGQCGSCWAFSSTGAMEGQHFRYTGKLVPLSEQNLVDCAKENAGCDGGWMDNAFKYVEHTQGIDDEQDYPYTAKDGTCKYDWSKEVAKCDGFADIESGDEEALQCAVAEIGPISVAIDAAHQSFQLYKSGIYFENACSNTTTDHAVLAVGYGTLSDGYNYWLVKNSWGTSWGMDGYIQMARGYDNMCAIATYATFPLVPNNDQGPPKFKENSQNSLFPDKL